MADDPSPYSIMSNDGLTVLGGLPGNTNLTVTSTGVKRTSDNYVYYTYSGANAFIGLTKTVNATVPEYAVGNTFTTNNGSQADGNFYIVTAVLVTYKHMTDPNNNKIQVDSAIRDGNGVKIDTNYAKKSELTSKQDTLVSGTNIRTVNNNSLLGSTNISVGTVTGVTAGTGLNTTSNNTSTDGGTISSSGTLYLTKTAVTAGSYGPSADATLSAKGTFSVPYVTVDKYGRLTAASTKTMTLPDDVNVTQQLITTNNNYPILMAGTTTGVSTTNLTTTTRRNNSIYANPSTGNVQATTFNGYTLAGACAKAVTDSSSASAISTGTSVPTERDIYYGLPTINGAHTYTSSTNIYAPTSVGTSGQVLVSAGSGAPSWQTISMPNIGSTQITIDEVD